MICIVSIISNTYLLNLYFKYNLEVIPFYSQNGKFAFRATFWGLRSITDMPQFALIAKPVFDFQCVIIKLFQFLYYS